MSSDYWGGGGGAKGMLAPISNYWGTCPPPTYAYVSDLQANQDTNTMSTASSLHKAITSFDFTIALCVVKTPLDILNLLSNSMQDPVCCVLA